MKEHPESPVSQQDRELATLYLLQVRELEEYAMFVVNPDGRIKTWNRGVEKAFGYKEDEWLGQPASLIFTEEDRKAGIPEAEMRTAAAEGRSPDLRWHVRKDGTLIYMAGVLKALRDGNGTLIGYSKVVIDDTPRKRAEDALTQSNADLRQFAFIASHDLQEPLRTITVFTQLLERRLQDHLDSETGQMLGVVSGAAQRVSTMVRDLLAYSQVEQEGGAAVRIYLDEDLETAVSFLRTAIQETGTVVTHDPLPAVQVQHAQIVRVFQNLISNAIKFRNPDEPPNIHVWSERSGDEWIIRVRDNGLGFPTDQAPMLFAPFKRLHGPEYPGSGIGLAACKRIVERFGGRIGAESEPGKGSTFWFTVPADAT